MSAIFPFVHRRPPRLYRLARWLGRISLAILVVVLVYLASAVYSAARLVDSTPAASSPTLAFANDTVELRGSVTISNPGLYPVEGFQVTLRVLNDTGLLLGESIDAAATLPAGSATVYPVTIDVGALGLTGPLVSLLITDQPISTDVWGNATFAYLVPVSVHFTQNRTWGAPFSGLRISPGPVNDDGRSVTVPVTVSFANHASVADQGTLAVALHDAAGDLCGNTTYSIDVASAQAYSQTEVISVPSGCSLSGGSVDAAYVTSGTSVELPSEEIP